MHKSAMMIATAAVAALLVAGCTDQSAQTSGDGHTDHDHGTSHSGAGAEPGPAAGSDADSSASHNGEDVMFAQHMIPHHSQAVEMTDILLAKQGVDPRVIELAREIKAAQAPEIAQMQGWLGSWGNPPMPAMDHGSMEGGLMEGMVAPADIEKLREASGPEATKLFLDQMIGHHEGAITMAQKEIDGGQFEPAITMSHAIIDSQQHEIDEMKAIIQTL